MVGADRPGGGRGPVCRSHLHPHRGPLGGGRGGRIRTANDSKAFTGTILATFTVTANADVYVASNDAITSKPSWLADWSDSGANLVNSEAPPKTFSLLKRSFPAGATVTLGNDGSTSASMFTVVVASAPPPPALITNLVVNDTANAAAWPVRTKLATGNTQYGDRTFTLTALPRGASGADWIRTANLLFDGSSTQDHYKTLYRKVPHDLSGTANPTTRLTADQARTLKDLIDQARRRGR